MVSQVVAVPKDLGTTELREKHKNRLLRSLLLPGTCDTCPLSSCPCVPGSIQGLSTCAPVIGIKFNPLYNKLSHLLYVEDKPDPACEFLIAPFHLAFELVLVGPVAVVRHVEGRLVVELVCRHELRLVLLRRVAMAFQMGGKVVAVPSNVCVANLTSVDHVAVDGFLHPVEVRPLVGEDVVGVVAFKGH